MGTVNLDQARKARKEAKGQGPKVKFGGRTFELASELPYAVLEGLTKLDSDGEQSVEVLSQITKALMGKHYDAFIEKNPSLDDLNALLEGVMSEYGLAQDGEEGKAE